MNKFVFGITGATGAGKTTVSNIFRDLGVYIVDCDIIAKQITSSNIDCLFEIESSFGKDVFEDDGALNRRKLADIVFGNDDKLKLLNKITHKYIKEQIEYEIKTCDNDIIAIDGAVIIGSPVEEICRLMVVVSADEKVRAQRIMARDGISYEFALKRISSQKSNEEYEQYADFIIENNDNVRLGEYIEKIYNIIKNFSEAERKKNS